MKSAPLRIAAAAVTLGLGATPLLATTSIGDLSPEGLITIRGEVTDVVGNDFMLRDNTGAIRVDAGPVWYREHNFKRGEQLTVIGKAKDGEFDAVRIERTGGEVIEVRPDRGPPPWAGARGEKGTPKKDGRDAKKKERD